MRIHATEEEVLFVQSNFAKKIAERIASANWPRLSQNDMKHAVSVTADWEQGL